MQFASASVLLQVELLDGLEHAPVGRYEVVPPGGQELAHRRLELVSLEQPAQPVVGAQQHHVGGPWCSRLVRDPVDREAVRCDAGKLERIENSRSVPHHQAAGIEPAAVGAVAFLVVRQHGAASQATATATPTATATATPTATATNTPTATATSTATATATASPTAEDRRVTEGLVVLYTFEEGEGAVVHDVSNSGDPLDLEINDGSNITWFPGGLAIDGATLIASTGPAAKVIDAAQARDEITLEAWIRPANTTQDGPARIVTLSSGPTTRNMTLGQGLWGVQPSDLFDLRLRTTESDANGQPSLHTPPGTLQERLIHLVFTRDQAGQDRLYLDGAQVAVRQAAGSFANWDGAFALALANEVTGDRPWLGSYHLVAIYGRAFTAAEVIQNHQFGPDGQ